MKSLTLLILSIVTISLFAQTTDNLILGIEKTKNEILSAKGTLIKNTIIDNNKGSKIAYFKDNNLLLVCVKQKESNIDKKVDWYFENGVLMLSETNWTDTKSEKSIKCEKQYLSNGHLIAWITTDNKSVDTNAPEFKSLDKELAEYGLKIKSDIIR